MRISYIIICVAQLILCGAARVGVRGCWAIRVDSITSPTTHLWAGIIIWEESQEKGTNSLTQQSRKAKQKRKEYLPDDKT